jgi:hypothetical protein
VLNEILKKVNNRAKDGASVWSKKSKQTRKYFFQFIPQKADPHFQREI